MLQTPNGYYLTYKIPDYNFVSSLGFQLDQPIKLQVNRQLLKRLLTQHKYNHSVYICKATTSTNNDVFIALKFTDITYILEISRVNDTIPLKPDKNNIDILCNLLQLEIEDVLIDYKRYIMLIHQWMSKMGMPEDLEWLVLDYVQRDDKYWIVETSDVVMNRLDDRRFSFRFVENP